MFIKTKMSSTILVCMALFVVYSNGSPMQATESTWDNNISAVETVEEGIKTCADVPASRSGVYGIQPQLGFSDSFPVFCDQEYLDGGWTVIQNRFDGSVDFHHRGWAEYENGFGDLHGEFWLGLRKIHVLTGLKQHELHVILEDFDGVTVEAKYSHFSVGGEGEKYRLNNLGTYSGTAGDSLSYSVNQCFTTFDADNDSSDVNCAQKYKSGWWFKDCRESTLNGMYLPGHRIEYGLMMCWRAFRGDYYGLKRSRMLIRPFRGV